jgi:hypothetical protein
LRRTRLNHAGILGVALLLYLAAVLGGWRWLVPPSLAGLAYLWLGRCHGVSGVPAHTLTRAFALAGPGLVWLILWCALASPWILPCFAVSFTAAIATMAVAEWGGEGRRGWNTVVRAASLGACAGIAGAVVVFDNNTTRQTAVAVVLAAGAVAAGLFNALEWRRPVNRAREARWFIQGGIIAAVSVLGGLIR